MRFLCPSPSLQCLAAAATDVASMSSYRAPYLGWNSWRRGFSYQPNPFVSGDSHFRSVSDTNSDFRQGGINFPISGEFQEPQPPHYRQPPPPYSQPIPPYAQRRPSPPYAQPPPLYGQQPPSYGQPPPSYGQPPPSYGQRSLPYGQFPPPYAQPPPFYGQPPPPYVQAPPRYRLPRPFNQPRAKPPDYRHWQYSLSQPPSNCERFIVLSYNILADYLALNHRRELYFHIPRHILDWEWRKRKIVFELGLWSPDIMCLQEVDRFQDIEEELKLRGYSGIWKMRTGIPTDGCAIFWRTTRFQLLHEEYLEFNKLGLRDNVAQICVLELRSSNSLDNCSAAVPPSSNGVNQVVICNIHVLYNPRRGEIKLGQVRLLLDRAHAVSKLWNDAPVIVCGDFNCTPKSPLYNFISEQKLDLTGIARDQISGQYSAELNRQKQHDPNYGRDLPRAQTPDDSVGASMLVVEKHSNHISNVDNKPKRSDSDSVPSISNLSQLECANALLDIISKSYSDDRNRESNMYSDVAVEEVQEGVLDSCRNESGSRNSVLSEQLNDCSVSRHKESILSSDLVNNGVLDMTSPLTCSEYNRSVLVGPEHEKSSSGSSDQCDGTITEQFHTGESVHEENEKGSLNFGESVTSFGGEIRDTKSEGDEKPENCGISNNSLNLISAISFPNDDKISSGKGLENSLEGIVNEDMFNPSTSDQSTCEVNTSYSSTFIDQDLNHKLATLNKPSEVKEEDESFHQDHESTFSSMVNSSGDVQLDLDLGSESVIAESEKADHDSKECDTVPCNSQLSPSYGEVQGDSSPSIDSELANVKNTSDLYSWTPMEIQTASGKAECTLLEHPLKLRSTYAEVEDYSGTRDSSREPEVTSYNRRFMGTVDYIWCSEGLQTVKVLDTIPKRAMQWTPGFPTPKWGSDHIALVSQLAFTKDVENSAG